MGTIKIGSSNDKTGIKINPKYVLFNGNNVKKIISGTTEIWDCNPIGLVPIMTSNTTPSGYTVIASSTMTNYGYQAYYVFDGSDSGAWYANSGSQYIGIQFPSPTVVKGFKLRPLRSGSVNCVNSYRIDASVDGTNWLTIYSSSLSNTADATAIDKIDNNNAYLYYRLYVLSTHSSSYSPGVLELQFYDKEPS